MKLKLWQQFASNHSSSFTVVGEFPTPEAAQNAVLEIRRILKKIADWHEAHEGEFDDAWVSSVWNDLPTPAELELAQQYGIEWHGATVWFDDVNIEILFDRYVFVTPERHQESTGEPFDQVMDKLGGKGYIQGKSQEYTQHSILFTLTCDAPDEATAQAIIDKHFGYYRYTHRTGTRLMFDRWRFDEYPEFTDLVAQLREKGCQNIEFSFSQWNMEQPYYAPDDFDRVVKVLEKGTLDVDRRGAVDWLEMLGDKRAVEPLVKALDDYHSSVQIAAAHALKSLGDERAVEALIRVLGNTANTLVRANSVKVLGGFDTAQAVDGLLRGLQDTSPYVWIYAANELGKKDISVQVAVQKLADIPGMEERVAQTLRLMDATNRGGARLERIRSSDDKIRHEAVEEARQRRDIETLISAMQNPADETQANLVADALGEIGDASAIPALLDGLKSGAAHSINAALLRIGEPAVAPLAAYLQDDNNEYWTRERSLWVLAKLGAIDALLPLLADERFRTPVFLLIADFGGKQAVPVLVSLLKDTDETMRRNAIHCLHQLKASEAIEALNEVAQNDPLEQVRHHARWVADALSKYISNDESRA